MHILTCGYRGVAPHHDWLSTPDKVLTNVHGMARTLLRQYRDAGIDALVTVAQSDKRHYSAMVRIVTPAILPGQAQWERKV